MKPCQSFTGYWYDVDISIQLSYTFWLPHLSSLAYINSELWIGALPALDMVNWTFYGLWKLVCFFYLPLLFMSPEARGKCLQNRFSFIRLMNKSDGARHNDWLVVGGEKSSLLVVPRHRFQVRTSAVTFQGPSCVNYISAACDSIETSQSVKLFPHQEDHGSLTLIVWYSKCCHPLSTCNSCLPLNFFLCSGLFSTHIWLCLTPGEFPLLG